MQEIFFFPFDLCNSQLGKKKYLAPPLIISTSLSRSCGNCGYDLNLSSSSRNTSTIGSKYGKSMKKGIISFFYIDESRFTQVEEFKCVPFFISKHSWGLFRRRNKLLCRKCSNLVGIAYDDNAASYPLVSDGSDSASGSETSSTLRKYDVRIRALQPSGSAGSGIPVGLWCTWKWKDCICILIFCPEFFFFFGLFMFFVFPFLQFVSTTAIIKKYLCGLSL